MKNNPPVESLIVAEIAGGGGLSLPQAARRFPSARRGRPVSASCLWRWCHKGARVPGGGVVRLEAVRLAGRWLTSEEAIVRFLAAQTPPPPDAPPPAPRTPRRRQQAAERAAKKLDKMGI